MFCDGKCEVNIDTDQGTFKKTCGLFVDVHIRNNITGETDVKRKCAFLAMMGGIYRVESAMFRVQKATESARNEQAMGSSRIVATIAKGFRGLIQLARPEEQCEYLLEPLTEESTSPSQPKESLKEPSPAGEA